MRGVVFIQVGKSCKNKSKSRHVLFDADVNRKQMNALSSIPRISHTTNRLKCVYKCIGYLAT